jgi:hypothetical protein
VSTPVAGFRDHEPAVTIASASEFAAAVEQALSVETSGRPVALPTWEVRADAMEQILARVRNPDGESAS